MLSLSISNARFELIKYKKIQWNMSQNGELTAGYGVNRGFLLILNIAYALSPTLSQREREKDTAHRTFPSPAGSGRKTAAPYGSLSRREWEKDSRTIRFPLPPGVGERQPHHTVPSPAGRGLGRGVPPEQNAPMQKGLLKEQAFRMWSAREDDSPLRGSPCGSLLKQRCLAALGANLLPPEFLILINFRRKKTCF